MSYFIQVQDAETDNWYEVGGDQDFTTVEQADTWAWANIDEDATYTVIPKADGGAVDRISDFTEGSL